jgi:hypothetical protein
MDVKDFGQQMEDFFIEGLRKKMKENQIELKEDK